MKVEIKEVKISEIKLNPDNPRRISKQDMDRLVKSLAEFPDMLNIREIVVDETMTILGGNMRYLALKKSGAKAATAKIVTGLTKEQKREFVIKDNSNFGEYDFDALANGWSDLPLADWGVDLPEDWLGGVESEPADAEPQIDRAEELNQIWQVKPGDLWQIGEHRLLCGDSTKKEDVERVMGGEKADMVFTDPPYGMNLDTDYSGIMNRGNKYEKVIGDDKEWLFDSANYYDCDEQIWWGADWYRRTLPIGGSWFVWDKQISEHDGASHTGSLFELAWSKTPHKREIIKVPFFRFYGMDTEKRLHPTQKPERLCAWFIEKFSKEYAVIADPFIGSGTTMVACQNLNRKCRGIEISPSYCAVILQRMTDAFPGIEIKKVK